MKDLDYVMKIKESWMALDDLEGAKTRGYFTDSSGMKEMGIFTYLQPFGINF